MKQGQASRNVSKHSKIAIPIPSKSQVRVIHSAYFQRYKKRKPLWVRILIIAWHTHCTRKTRKSNWYKCKCGWHGKAACIVLLLNTAFWWCFSSLFFLCCCLLIHRMSWILQQTNKRLSWYYVNVRIICWKDTTWLKRNLECQKDITLKRFLVLYWSCRKLTDHLVSSFIQVRDLNLLWNVFLFHCYTNVVYYI